MSRAPLIDLDGALTRLAEQLRGLLARDPSSIVIGIETGGVWIAETLAPQLGLAEAPGTLNCGFHRDDFSTSGLHPRIGPSRIEADITDRGVILIDDVFYTGRTARAAMNALFEYGRPACVRLAVLIDRDARELPFTPDAVGAHVNLAGDWRIKLQGPSPLALVVE